MDSPDTGAPTPTPEPRSPVESGHRPASAPEERPTPALAEPPLSSHDHRPLDRRVVGYWRLRLAAVAVPAAAVATAAASFIGPLGATLTGLAALAAVGTTVSLLPRARYRAWGFAIRRADLVVQRGVVWRTVSIVPHARIQHVDTRQGPLERRLGLARVVVHTAGSIGGSVDIPGLAVADAESLRDRLAALGGGDDGV